MSAGPGQVESHVRLLAATLVVLALAYVALALTAAADAPWPYVAAFAFVLVLEWVTERVLPALVQLLKVCQLGPESRGLLQTLTFALLADRHFEDWGTATVVGVVAVALALPLSRSVYLLILFQLRGQLLPSMETRNIDLGPTGPSVPSLLTDQVDRRLVHLGAGVLLVGALGVTADVIWPFVGLAVLYVVALAAGAVLVVLRLRGQPSASTWDRRTLERIRALEPEVILYFSGSPDATYQLNMWLQPLADLGRPALVMVRERHLLQDLAPTDLPVVCMPNAVTVMQAKLTSARVALYAAHTSKNIHLLREPGLRHVFIGHGDSDKVSSINPFARAYDQVWVAGRAGRDRWATADVGVRDDAVVEVGLPQLGAVARARPRTTGVPLNVLYAPTWEGWTDEDFSTSLTHMGPRLVEGLLAATPEVRVIYKPHPFTGIRDKRAKRSHEAIVAMLAAANGPSGTTVRAAALADLDRRLAAPGVGPAEDERLSSEWSQEFWTHLPEGRHVVVDGTRPTLVDCFNHADVLVSDVSSVVTDFIASGKPYVCANPHGIPAETFVEDNPSTGAAYLLGPDCSELVDILAAVSGDDPKAPQRRVLREYLLGPDEPPSIVKWRAAVDALAATAAGRVSRDPGGADEAFDDGASDAGDDEIEAFAGEGRPGVHRDI